MAHKWADLKKLSDDELIAEHDAVAGYMQIGRIYYLDELRYRQQSRNATRAGRFHEVDFLADPRRHVGDCRQRCGQR